MKCKIPEISWHNRDPVLSVDIQPRLGKSGTKYRLASGGTDAHVLIWYMNYGEDGNDIKLDLAADLTRHQRAVNAVKWSPNGELLASGDDESVVFIWKQKTDHEPLNILDNTNEQDKEVWIIFKILRGHMEDIYDLSWAPNSMFLVSGSVDNTAIVWDVQKGKSLGLLRDHKSFVQGVAWDPKNQYIATLSSDRYLRIFDIQTRKVLHRINKSSLPIGEGHELHGHRLSLFHDDTLQTFFRRLCFTPDGKLLLTPAGVAEKDDVAQSLHTTYVFSRYAFRQPAIVLPCPGQYTVAVRCCPILYRLRPHNAAVYTPVVPLPYRMIFAVATRSSVYFYDTQQRQPFAVISNIHYTRLTDVTWSNDGRIVVVSSTDGFCSLITFEAGELGEEYEHAAEVLNANDTNSLAKKSKKHKENESQTAKERKLTTNEGKEIITSKREPLVELTEEQKAVELMEFDEVQLPCDQDSKKLLNDEKTETAEPNQVFDSVDTATEGVQQSNINPAVTVVIAKTVDGAALMDKEILSCDERFDLPENKSLPPTPEEQKVVEPMEFDEIQLPCDLDSKNLLDNKKTETVETNKLFDATNVAAEGAQQSNSNPAVTLATAKRVDGAILMDKEILSCDERFDSPEKNSLPPISEEQKVVEPMEFDRVQLPCDQDSKKLLNDEKTETAEPNQVFDSVDTATEGVQQSNVNPAAVTLATAKRVNAAALTEKEILSCDERFDSPENKSLPPTPEGQTVVEPMEFDEVQLPCDQDSKKLLDEETEAVETNLLVDAADTATEGAQQSNLNPGVTLSITKSLGVAVLMDKEILSCDERFESPEKKSRPATPIMIRRTPRGAPTPIGTTNPNTSRGGHTPKSAISTNTLTKDVSSPTSVKLSTELMRQSKGATPISVRRIPRAIITPQLVANSAAEEALDAWPTPMEMESEEPAQRSVQRSSKEETAVTSNEMLVAEGTKPVANTDVALECTEDIRLVYEESIDNSIAETTKMSEVVPRTAGSVEKGVAIETPFTVNDFTKTPNKKTPMSGSKTPRRVALRTISTPKSKKKLLD